MLHTDCCTSVSRRKECAVKSNILDIAARKLKAVHEVVKVDIVERQLIRKRPSPYLRTL